MPGFNAADIAMSLVRRMDSRTASSDRNEKTGAHHAGEGVQGHGFRSAHYMVRLS